MFTCFDKKFLFCVIFLNIFTKNHHDLNILAELVCSYYFPSSRFLLRLSERHQEYERTYVQASVSKLVFLSSYSFSLIFSAFAFSSGLEMTRISDDDIEGVCVLILNSSVASDCASQCIEYDKKREYFNAPQRWASIYHPADRH